MFYITGGLQHRQDPIQAQGSYPWRPQATGLSDLGGTPA